MDRAVTDNPGRQAAPGDLRGPIIGALVVAALLAWLFWEFLWRQLRWAIEEQADWGHTLVIPLISVYFIYLSRAKLLARPFKTTWIGFVPILFGIGLYTVSTLGPQMLSHHNIRGASVVLTLFGIALLFFGFRAMLWLWFPLVYLFLFGQTISDRALQVVTFRLQDVTARGAHVALLVFGLEVDREGNTLMIVDGQGTLKPLNIAEACSGMRMLMAFLALGVAMAYTGLKRNWQRITVVLMGIPTAIFVNILRVVSLGLLALVDADFAAGDFHSFIGLVWLVPAFLIFLGVIWIVRNVVHDEPPDAGPAAGATSGPNSAARVRPDVADLRSGLIRR